MKEIILDILEIMFQWCVGHECFRSQLKSYQDNYECYESISDKRRAPYGLRGIFLNWLKLKGPEGYNFWWKKPCRQGLSSVENPDVHEICGNVSAILDFNAGNIKGRMV